jgi:hypothetical protein
MWLCVPIPQKTSEFFTGFREYPSQTGSSLNTVTISSQTITIAAALDSVTAIFLPA